jgi:hypothetical protein
LASIEWEHKQLECPQEKAAVEVAAVLFKLQRGSGLMLSGTKAEVGSRHL